jgi:hypothetical protein
MYEEALDRLFSNANNKIRPIKLHWGGSATEITEVRFAYTSAQGKSLRFVFACSNGVDHFEVKFDEAEIDVLVRALM